MRVLSNHWKQAFEGSEHFSIQFPDYDITTASALSSRSLFTLYKPTLMIADTRHSCSCSSLSRCVA